MGMAFLLGYRGLTASLMALFTCKEHYELMLSFVVPSGHSILQRTTKKPTKRSGIVSQSLGFSYVENHIAARRVQTVCILLEDFGAPSELQYVVTHILNIPCFSLVLSHDCLSVLQGASP